MKNFKNLAQTKSVLVMVGLSLTLAFSACKKDDEEPSALDKLQGEWVRTDGNNPTNNGMELDVSGDEATVTDPAASNYPVGAAKWRNITTLNQSTFSHEELGSDGTYYDGTITLVNDSTINLTVASTGSGNIQVWERPRESGVGPSVTQTLACNTFRNDTILPNGPADIDYLVTCVMDVEGEVVIEPGTVIAFEENGGIGVYGSGSFNATGTASQPIIFRGEIQEKGFWRGIHFESNNSKNALENVVIEDAGSNYVYCCGDPASLTHEDGQLSLRNVTIRNGKGIGLILLKEGELNDYQNINITTHDEYPVGASLVRVNELDGMNSDYTGNAEDFIFIYGTAVNQDVTVSKVNVPYFFESDIYDVTEALIINEGVEIVMDLDVGIGVYSTGYMSINGTASEKVIIRGNLSERGHWRGIHIESNNSRNKIDHAVISDAGNNYVYCCGDAASITLDKAGQGSVTNTEISNGAGYGIIASGDFSLNDYSNNTITTHDEEPLYIAVERIGELDGLGSDYTGNEKDFLRLRNMDVDDDIVWQKTNVPYLIGNFVIDVIARIDIEAGTHIVAEAGAGIGVYNNGILNIGGTAAEPVMIEGKEDVQGYWRGIHTQTNSSSNQITYTTIANAGSNYVYCCNAPAGLYVESGQMTIENSTIRDSGGCGIGSGNSATVVDTNNTFSNNANGDVCE